jgi:hypothetical protein
MRDAWWRDDDVACADGEAFFSQPKGEIALLDDPEGAENPVRPLSSGGLVLMNESSEHISALNAGESDDGL